MTPERDPHIRTLVANLLYSPLDRALITNARALLWALSRRTSPDRVRAPLPSEIIAQVEREELRQSQGYRLCD